MKVSETKYFTNRTEWRNWLETNFDKKNEIWLEYPKKKTGKEKILYNDAVEEALCFGWIDSTVKSLNKNITVQRFSKRKANSSYSQANRERLKWLYKNNLIHESILEKTKKIINEQFIFPETIIEQLEKDKETWKNYKNFTEPYKRIRIAYIESAKKRPEEYEKRLKNLLSKAKENKLIKGYGGIEKYYK